MQSVREESNKSMVGYVNDFGVGLVFGGVIGFSNPEVYNHIAIVGFSAALFPTFSAIKSIGNIVMYNELGLKDTLKTSLSLTSGTIIGQYAGQTAKMFFG